MCNCFNQAISRGCNSHSGNEMREALRTAEAAVCSAAQFAKEAEASACNAEQIAKNAETVACNARRSAREAANCARAAEAAAERIRYMLNQQTDTCGTQSSCGCGSRF